jgi:hypothetical protein
MPPDEIDAVAADWRPSRVADRRAIFDAIAECAVANSRYVHIADVREHLTRDVDPHQLGTQITALRRSGYLVQVGWRPNGNRKTRNASRPAPLYPLAKPLPQEDAA